MLAARGSELESPVPFGVIRQLLEPVVFVGDLARRVEGQRLTILLATRPATEGADPLLVRVVADPIARVLRPRPLSRDGGAALTGDALSAEPAPAS